jgi:hypothetical protein
VARRNHPGMRMDFAAGADVVVEVAGIFAADFGQGWH